MTKATLMRSLLPSRLFPRAQHVATATRSALNGARLVIGSTSATTCYPQTCLTNCRCFAHVNDIDIVNRDVWFTSAAPRFGPQQHSDHQPPDERTVKLGKTIRTLHDRLPTLLQSPLPGEILSPQITLHLFPSTHPHLPTVSGRIAYNAALWTAPVAWGRFPLVGNVQLTILSERMVRNGGKTAPRECQEEKLVVKWKTCGKTKHRDGTGGVYRGIGIGTRDPVDRIKDFIAGSGDTEASAKPGKDDEEFTGIFVFEFDEQGRIVKHVIEHTEEGGSWDRSMTRVVSVTDWLLGQFNGKNKERIPELAFCEERPMGNGIRLMDRRSSMG